MDTSPPVTSSENTRIKSTGYPNIADTTTEEKEAGHIHAVCRHYSYRDLENLSCLYLGAFDSVMTECFARSFKKVFALDIDQTVLRRGKRISNQENIKYICSDGASIALNDESVDVVICDRFYDRVKSQRELMLEIYRVLKYDGFCYFSAFNRLSLIERHYGLPFLAWLPRKAADFFLKLAGQKGNYDFRLLTLSRLRNLTDNFWRHDYIGLIRQSPETFLAEDIAGRKRSMSKRPGRFLKYIYPFLPLWIWILTKKR